MSKVDQPYIFISYAHKDIAIISPFISALKEKYAVWFDEGIRYGKEWEEEIADKLNGCSVFIYAITENSLNSENCKDELYHARNKSKNFLNVMFSDDVELPEWFEFRYGRYQMCYYNRFSSPQEVVADLAKKCEWFEEVRLSESASPPKKDVIYETIRYYNGDVYEGETLNGKRHGKGKCVYADGTFYEGDWVEGNQHGKGKKTYTNGAFYEGDWVEGNQHGKGKHTWPDGSFYEGDWADGKPHGKGKESCSDGWFYEGDWVDGNWHGKGKYVCADDTFYEGEYVNGIIQGKGTATYDDGSFYEGDYKDNRRHGKGKYVYANGDFYEGDWADGKKHGKGKLTYADGTVKEGYWKNDKFIG